MQNKEYGFRELAELRKITAEETGKIGLYWLSKDMGVVMPCAMQTLAANADGRTSVPNFYSVMKTHKQAWTEFDKEYIKYNGGNHAPKGWKSLPRGFVCFNTAEKIFGIVGGSWLSQDIAQKIADTFGIKEFQKEYFPDYDGIIEDTDL